MSEIDYAINRYNQAFRGSERDRNEMERMMGLYTGFGKSQWSTEAKNTLLSRGNIVPQINLTRGKIDRLAGSIIKNFFDIQFVPVSSAETPLTRLLNDIFVTESNMFDYDNSYLKCVVDGLIHCGVEQMKLSTRYNALGDIEFERIMPGRVLLDPHWTSDDSWDLENVWKVAYLTPQQVINTYNHRNREIKDLVSHLHKAGYEYYDDQENPSSKFYAQNPMYNQLYRVVEHHFLETTVKDVQFVRLKDDTKVQLPEGNTMDGVDYLEKMGLSDKVKNDFKRRVHFKEYKVEALCPELDRIKFLDRGKSDIQIGRLPFFPLSALRYGGHNAGMVSMVEDVQKLLNSREAKSDDLIASSADGSYLFDPMLFGNDKGKIAEAMKAMHIPGAKIPVENGMLASGRNMIEPLQRQPYPPEFQYEITRMEGYFDKLTGQTATLDGQKESAHDTGVLFSKRAAQAEMALALLTKNLENHQRDKFESWFLYAKHVFSGPVRVFSKTNDDKTREDIQINVRTYNEDGKVVIHNDFSGMKRHNVIVSQSRNGLTNKELDRTRSLELLNVVTDPIKRIILEQQALETLDDSAKQKAELRRYNDLSLARAVKQFEADIVQLDAMIAQGRQQQLMMATGQGQQPEEGQEANPEEQVPAEETL